MKKIFFSFLIIISCSSIKELPTNNMYLIEQIVEGDVLQDYILSPNKILNAKNREVYILNSKFYLNCVILSDYEGARDCCSDPDTICDNRDKKYEIDTLLFLENNRFRNREFETIINNKRIYRINKFKYCICNIKYTGFTGSRDKFIYPYELKLQKINRKEKRIFKRSKAFQHPL